MKTYKRIDLEAGALSLRSDDGVCAAPRRRQLQMDILLSSWSRSANGGADDDDDVHEVMRPGLRACGTYALI